MSDLKAMQPFVEAVQQAGRASLLVVDPPWENASARRSGRYATLTPNHLLYMPVKQLLRQDPGSLVALWVTNRRRMHRFVVQQLLPAWGLQHAATWLWLKVADSGQAVSPITSLHRHPWEQLWLCRPLGGTTAAGSDAQPQPPAAASLAPLVLQAAPAEFGAMRRVAAATAPPGTQMLGVLGRLANLAS
ncbi:hypothetical protein OEZ85_014289 [Tetradesmus obliquus]|uniref:Uncharacterized protein n=1 Tax=Tetradesmus obliquus TaxID=3088 RepID=A0ABY8U854_TETOB|nr:hypothetical protein OEZ85_014289 [Tetradesmus obliquus]